MTALRSNFGHLTSPTIRKPKKFAIPKIKTIHALKIKGILKKIKI